MFHIFVKLQQLNVDLLALTDDEDVKKICQRLRVANARSASDHYRHRIVTFCRKHGYSGKVKHFKHVIVRKLVLQREAHKIKL